MRDYAWLHNRSKRFVAHCIRKIAEDISADKMRQEDESVLVKNSTSGGTCCVNVRSGEVLPHVPVTIERKI